MINNSQIEQLLLESQHHHQQQQQQHQQQQQPYDAKFQQHPHNENQNHISEQHQQEHNLLENKKDIFQIQNLEGKLPSTEILSDCTELKDNSKCILSKITESYEQNKGDIVDKSCMPDASKKNSPKAYGLRPRTELRKPSYDCDTDDREFPVEVIRRPRGQNRNSNLSKYRRRTANARERHRMKEINDAFSTLRGILPPLSNRRSSQVSMTKIRTLRLAASYIQALSDLLRDSDEATKKATLSTSTINFQHYSDSIIQKIQSKSSSATFHSTCNFKTRKTKKPNSEKPNGQQEHDNQANFCPYNSERISLINSEANTVISETENSIKNSWDVPRIDGTEDDDELMALLEDSNSPSSEIDTSFHSWVDYKSLEDFYFAFN
ncbi:UNVERIFIED_CONTAM: hypothetical protein RMT77_019394 [Armadillidium vulgare]